MDFKKHSEIQGRHAFLSPSQPAWLNYTPEKLVTRYHAAKQAQRGTDLHNLAHEAVRLGVLLSPENRALATYVNDAIHFNMVCEQPLFYSFNCFGHADTLSFRSDKLRIHDLKTGLGQTKMTQLVVYAALFCLEYGIDPFKISFELRIYQNDVVEIYEATSDEVDVVMHTIREHDAHIERLKLEKRA